MEAYFTILSPFLEDFKSTHGSKRITGGERFIRQQMKQWKKSDRTFLKGKDAGYNVFMVAETSVPWVKLKPTQSYSRILDEWKRKKEEKINRQYLKSNMSHCSVTVSLD